MVVSNYLASKHGYKTEYIALKRKLKNLIREKISFEDTLRDTERKILSAQRENMFLMRQLAELRPLDEQPQTSDYEETDLSDDEANRSAPKRRRTEDISSESGFSTPTLSPARRRRLRNGMSRMEATTRRFERMKRSRSDDRLRPSARVCRKAVPDKRDLLAPPTAAVAAAAAAAAAAIANDIVPIQEAQIEISAFQQEIPLNEEVVETMSVDN